MIKKVLSKSDIGGNKQRAINVTKDQEKFFDLKGTIDRKLTFEDVNNEKYPVTISLKPSSGGGDGQWRIIGLSQKNGFFEKNNTQIGDVLIIESTEDANKFSFRIEKNLIELEAKEIINLKVDFVQWFRKNSKTYENYQKENGEEAMLADLTICEENYGLAFDKDSLFNIVPDDLKGVIDVLTKRLYDDEFKQNAFRQFSDKENKITNGWPRSILGKNNYIKFLNELLLQRTKSAENIHFNITSFQNACESAGILFNDQIVTRFISSLTTKPFVILTGLSGSGKTKLTQSFAMWMSESKDQYAIVPVGADWTNREPLLGYPNSLKKSHYVKPDSGVLDILLRANENYKMNKEDLSLCKPYFLILDEMNLSHVERYFADFLSAMESGDEIKLYSGEDRSWEVDSSINKEGDFIPKYKVEQQVKMPKNLFIIGTVNIDETTYMFSPKVLDRANTIEFRISKPQMEIFLKNHKTLDMNQLLEDVKNNKGKGAESANEFIRLAKGEDLSFDSKKHQATFVQFFQELQQVGSEFGYRTANEMTALIAYLNHFSISKNEAYDIAIMQKLLPKLNGSRSKLSKILPQLGGLCLVSGKKEDAEKIFEQYKNNQEVIITRAKEVNFSLSFEKLCRMYKNAQDNGFASYAEA